MRNRRRFVGALLLALAAAGGSAAETHEVPATRPKIGVAFSGGGAKGCAHIGVLRVLEELHIPIDYAAGTSMGAIIGGLYASGMSTAELEQAILETDWADALDDQTSRSQLSFRRKYDDLFYVSDFELGVGRGGIKAPLGLRSGQKLNYLLHRLTLPVRSVRDFDQLPIPFRAVATDIANGAPYVLEHGELARAMRASMAIPTAFSPVEIDGRLLVDGGVSNNLPVDVVRAMGADIVIAIDIGAPLLESQQVRRSYLSILDQTLGLITRSNMAAQVADADLVITPAVAKYGTLQFDRGPEIIALGEAEARGRAGELARYAVSEVEYEALRESRRREAEPIPVIANVRLEGNRRVDSRILTPLVHARAGEPFSPEVARDDLGRMFGLGDFEKVDLELVPYDDGSADLVYHVSEKPWGPNYLRAGISFESDFEGSNSLTLHAGLRASRLNALGAEWQTDLQFGEASLLRTEYYQPLSFHSGWFVAPSLAYRRDLVPLFDEGDRVAEIDLQGEIVGAEIGYLFGRYGELRFGAERSWIQLDRESGDVPDDLEPFFDGTIERGGLRLRGAIDTLDSVKLPKLGWLVRLHGYQSLESLGGEEDYLRAELSIQRFWTMRRHTLFGEVAGGASGNGTLPPYDLFRLGGLFSLSGFVRGEVTGDEFAMLRTGYYYRLNKLFHVGGYIEAAEVRDDSVSVTEDTILTGTALIVADTLAGPLYFGLGSANEGGTTGFILFGRRF